MGGLTYVAKWKKKGKNQSINYSFISFSSILLSHVSHCCFAALKKVKIIKKNYIENKGMK